MLSIGSDTYILVKCFQVRQIDFTVGLLYLQPKHHSADITTAHMLTVAATAAPGNGSQDANVCMSKAFVSFPICNHLTGEQASTTQCVREDKHLCLCAS